MTHHISHGTQVKCNGFNPCGQCPPRSSNPLNLNALRACTCIYACSWCVNVGTQQLLMMGKTTSASPQHEKPLQMLAHYIGHPSFRWWAKLPSMRGGVHACLESCSIWGSQGESGIWWGRPPFTRQQLVGQLCIDQRKPADDDASISNPSLLLCSGLSRLNHVTTRDQDRVWQPMGLNDQTIATQNGLHNLRPHSQLGIVSRNPANLSHHAGLDPTGCDEAGHCG